MSNYYISHFSKDFLLRHNVGDITGDDTKKFSATDFTETAENGTVLDELTFDGQFDDDANWQSAQNVVAKLLGFSDGFNGADTDTKIIIDTIIYEAYSCTDPDNKTESDMQSAIAAILERYDYDNDTQNFGDTYDRASDATEINTKLKDLTLDGLFLELTSNRNSLGASEVVTLYFDSLSEYLFPDNPTKQTEFKSIAPAIIGTDTTVTKNKLQEIMAVFKAIAVSNNNNNTEKNTTELFSDSGMNSSAAQTGDGSDDNPWTVTYHSYNADSLTESIFEYDETAKTWTQKTTDTQTPTEETSEYTQDFILRDTITGLFNGSDLVEDWYKLGSTSDAIPYDATVHDVDLKSDIKRMLPDYQASNYDAEIQLIIEEALANASLTNTTPTVLDIKNAIIDVLERYDTDATGIPNNGDVKNDMTYDSNNNGIADGLEDMTALSLFRDLGGASDGSETIESLDVKLFFNSVFRELLTTVYDSAAAIRFNNMITAILDNDNAIGMDKLTEIMEFVKGFADGENIIFTEITAATYDGATKTYTNPTTNSTVTLDDQGNWTYAQNGGGSSGGDVTDPPADPPAPTQSEYTRDLILRNTLPSLFNGSELTVSWTDSYNMAIFDSLKSYTLGGTYDPALKTDIKNMLTITDDKHDAEIQLIIEEALENARLTKNPPMLSDIKTAIIEILERYDTDANGADKGSTNDFTYDSDGDKIGDTLSVTTADTLFDDLGGTAGGTVNSTDVTTFFTELAKHFFPDDANKQSELNKLITAVMDNISDITQDKLTEIMEFVKGFITATLPSKKDTLFNDPTDPITAATYDGASTTYTDNTNSTVTMDDQGNWTYAQNGGDGSGSSDDIEI